MAIFRLEIRVSCMEIGYKLLEESKNSSLPPAEKISHLLQLKINSNWIALLVAISCCLESNKDLSLHLLLLRLRLMLRRGCQCLNFFQKPLSISRSILSLIWRLRKKRARMKKSFSIFKSASIRQIRCWYLEQRISENSSCCQQTSPPQAANWPQPWTGNGVGLVARARTRLYRLRSLQ